MDSIELLLQAHYLSGGPEPPVTAIKKCPAIIRFRPDQANWSEEERQHIVGCQRCRRILFRQWEYTPVFSLRDLVKLAADRLVMETRNAATLAVEAIRGAAFEPAPVYRSAPSSTGPSSIQARSSSKDLQGSLFQRDGGWVIQWTGSAMGDPLKTPAASVITSSGKFVERGPTARTHNLAECPISYAELPPSDAVLAFVVNWVSEPDQRQP